MKVLVHYNVASEEPMGLWWLDPITQNPQCLYNDPDGYASIRGRMIVFGRTNPDVRWGDWFDQLTTRTPYTENWIVYDSMGMTPEQLLKSMEPSPSLVS